MNAVTELFKNQVRGYDKEQVDSYIQKLTTEYCQLQSQLSELSNKYDLLTSESLVVKETHIEEVDAEVQPQLSPDTLVTTLDPIEVNPEAPLPVLLETKEEFDHEAATSSEVLKGKNHKEVNAEAISRALVDAEVRAIQITAAAEEEAFQITAAAKSRASQIISVAEKEVAELTGNAYVELCKIRQEKSALLTEVSDLLARLQELVPSGAV